MEHKFEYNWTLKDANFTKDKGNVFSTFSCGGGSTMGYKLAGYDVIGNLEIDENKNNAYVENHHPRFNFNDDIRKFRLRDDLPEELYNLDILDGSPPCFIAGTKVLTSDGYKSIEEVAIGDKVLTHNNRYRSVIAVMNHDADDLYDIKSFGSPSIRVTSNHPFYVRKMTKKSKRTWSSPQWMKVKDFYEARDGKGNIKEQIYLGYPVCQVEELPKWEGYRSIQEMPYGGQNVFERHDIDVSSCEFWTLVGRWFGDGWQRDPRKETIICCAKSQKEELASMVKNAGFNATISEQRSTYRFSIASVEFYEFIKRFGHGAQNKHLTNDIVNLPKAQLEAFLDGYLSADGSYGKRDKKWRCCSVSIDLILGLQRVVAKLYHQNASFRVSKGGNQTIEGRLVNTRDAYHLSFFKDARAQQHAFYEDGYIWAPLRSFENVSGIDTVYNFSVEEDESYTIYNIACHNCLAFSAVGDREKVWGKETKREGVKEAQTWDDLFFEQIALAKKLQPKVCVCENVKGMLLGGAQAYVRRVYEEFDKAGYYCQHFLLDASKMGVPQRRERVFFVCLRKDIATPFLAPYDLFEQKPYIEMTFNESPIVYGELCDLKGKPLGDDSVMRKLWENRREGDSGLREACNRVMNRDSFYSQQFVYKTQVCCTLTAHCDCVVPFDAPAYLSKDEVCKITSYPTDYDFGKNSFHELCGRSVPPVMMAQISSRIYEQWLSKL